MAAQNDPTVPLLTAVVIFGIGCLGMYLHYRVYRNSLEEKNAVIQANIRRAENGFASGSKNDFKIIPQSKLMDTRSRERVEQFVEIDHLGTIFVNNKGIHYVGANRRLSWDWNKLIEIRSYHIDSFFTSEIYFRLVVSNRQKISGFKFEGTEATRKIVNTFLERRQFVWKEKITPKTSTGTSRQKSSTSETNITYNIVQNVKDSVIQGNFERR